MIASDEGVDRVPRWSRSTSGKRGSHRKRPSGESLLVFCPIASRTSPVIALPPWCLGLD